MYLRIVTSMLYDNPDLIEESSFDNWLKALIKYSNLFTLNISSNFSKYKFL